MRRRLRFIEYFRGIAITQIVLGHTYPLAGLHWDLWSMTPEERFPGDFLLNLTAGGSTYFLFISGFLFSYIFAPNFDYGRFMRNKLNYVGLPYLALMTVLFIFFARQGDIAFPGSEERLVLTVENIYYVFVTYLTTGYLSISLWYIPFIFLVFACSHVFLAYERASVRWQTVLLVAALVLNLTVHRSPDNMNPVQNLFYYAFFYLFGVYCGRHREMFCNVVGRWPVVAGAAVAMVVLAWLQARFGVMGTLQAPPFAGTEFDFITLQRVCGIVMFCGLLLQFENRPVIVPLKALADYSFGIFFLHVFVLKLAMHLPHDHMASPLELWLRMAMWCAVAVVLSIAAVKGVRVMMGTRSRYLVGA
jgi:peptidoglycan/LPS O-acetylase OafA/YrhL